MIHFPHTTLIVGAWYGPVKGNNRTVAACISYWTAWSKALWTVRRQHPIALIVAGGDANVVLESLHPGKKQDKVASEFESTILHEHNLLLADHACPRRTHNDNALDLLVHSPNIAIDSFAIHDGIECSCGKSHCGPIAGSDHAFVTATLDILRPAERLLEPRWTWTKTTDWNAALKRFTPHFAILATWFASVSVTTMCIDRTQSQALISCLSYIWYAVALGALTSCGKWRPPNYGRKVQPWWNKECHAAAVRWSKSLRTHNDPERRAAIASYKRTMRLASQRVPAGTHHRQSNEPPPLQRCTRNTAKLAVIDPTTGHSIRPSSPCRLEELHATPPCGRQT